MSSERVLKNEIRLSGAGKRKLVRAFMHGVYSYWYRKPIHRKRCFPSSAHHVVDIMEDARLFFKGMGVPYAARRTHTLCRSQRTMRRWGPLCRRKPAWAGWIR